MGKTMIDLVCPVCTKPYQKVKYEHERNLKLGRVSVCGRSCQATYMDLSPVKHAKTKADTAARNADQFREKNPNWKGGVSEYGGHPLKTGHLGMGNGAGI